jgi:CRISPR-associated protein Cmr2
VNPEDDLRLRARIAARLHDPPEKALVLLRTREGHEGGTVRDLLAVMFPAGVPAAVETACRRADRWASAADRMAFPKAEGDRRYPAWQQVRFADDPVLIHPLTGQPHRLPPLADDVQAAHAQALGTDHLRGLVDATDARRTALALWRFGPELAGDLRELWRLLPADSRVPDHTIHDHLDLAAALAGCFAVEADGGPALLAVSIGPVQHFIAAARSVSDLWAGSHLLSSLAWVAMRVVCEACGPEALLFPRLRGVPLVDLWLRDQGLAAERFGDCGWRSAGTDANPLFAAALPNRFTAVVPAAQAREIAGRIVAAVRAEALAWTRAAFGKLLQAAGIADDPGLHGHAQIERQLAGFPEVHWAAVPWALASAGSEADGQVHASSAALAEAMQPFFDSDAPGFLGSETWRHLSGGYELDRGWFFRPNPGALYPALHELLERTLAAAKVVRGFAQTEEYGWRCSLTGETEWITTDQTQLALPPGQRKDTVWAKAAGRHGIRAGEHLGTLPMLKRLWPALFAESVQAHVEGERIDRYVVSTHTMALASAIQSAADQGIAPTAEMRGDRVALPRGLAAELRRKDLTAWAEVPGWLDAEAEADEAARRNGQASPGRGEKARSALAKLLGTRPDTYYGLLLMDGDDMGGWLGAASGKAPWVHESFHPTLRQRLGARFDGDPKFLAYANSRRAPNPAWHMAISQALHHFALELAPEIVEREHLGKLIYAGGDDVLAMLATSDLLGAAARLRAAYSGVEPEAVGAAGRERRLLARIANGWAQHDGRVLRLMGERATASAGLVIAHHQAPLGAVLRELRAAEKRAKALPGKDAWSLAVIKRGGGALYVSAHWGEPLRLFDELRGFLARDEVSRRAAYHVAEWLHDVPADAGLAAAMLGYQMARQCRGEAAAQAPVLARRLVALAFDDAQRPPGTPSLTWLADFMMAAEFLAREQRHAGAAPPRAQAPRSAGAPA